MPIWNNEWCDYLGGGVYARFDGYEVTLTVGRHDNLERDIVLDPLTIDALEQFLNRREDMLAELGTRAAGGDE